MVYMPENVENKDKILIHWPVQLLTGQILTLQAPGSHMGTGSYTG